MRKTIFIIAALFAATFANAQITLERTFEGGNLQVCTNGGNHSWNETTEYQAPYFFIWDESEYGASEYSCWLELYDPETLELYKRLVFKQYTLIYYITQNIFTTDNKVTFIANGKIMDEDGKVVFDMNLDSYKGIGPYDLVKIKGEYKLLVHVNDDGVGKTLLYSLPGNGEVQAISTPSSPKRSAHKIARDGQVLSKKSCTFATDLIRMSFKGLCLLKF